IDASNQIVESLLDQIEAHQDDQEIVAAITEEIERQIQLASELSLALQDVRRQRELIPLEFFPTPSFGPGAADLGGPGVAGASLFRPAGGGPAPTASADFLTGILDAFERTMLMSDLGASANETLMALQSLRDQTLRLVDVSDG